VIPAPLLLIAGPLIFAGVVYFLRRITVVASLSSAAAALWLAWLTWAIPPTAGEAILGGRVVGGAQSLLGRTIELSSADRPVLIAMSLAAAVLFLLAAGLPRGSTPGLTRPGDIFFPGLMALLGVAAAVLVTETFIFSVLLVEVAAGLTTILLQGSRFGSTRGAWRFFLFITLAMPFLLVAGWQIDLQAANPTQTELLNPAVLLLTFGFAIYLAAAPFHLWVSPAADETQPLTQVVVFGLFQMVTLSVIANALEQFPWFAGSDAPYQWFTFAGTLTAGLGTILAFSAGSFSQVAGYNLLVDMGTLLLLMGLQSQGGLQAAWLLILLRVISLTIWGTGLSIIRGRTGANQVGRAAQLATAVLLLGGLSLAGFPLTPGFPARWMAVGLVARDNIGRAVLLLLGSASGVVGGLRMVKTLLVPRPEPGSNPPAGKWDWLTTAALVAVLLGAIALALYPQPVISAAAQIAGYFTYAR